MPTQQNTLRQAAAIPVREGRVCLVLSSSGRRWVIPKGCIEAGQTPGETALLEAWEEAGLLGVLGSKPVGNYRYEKCGQSCHVTVFRLEVTAATKAWPEFHRRVRRWFRPEQALECVDDAGLRRLLGKTFAATYDVAV